MICVLLASATATAAMPPCIVDLRDSESSREGYLAREDAAGIVLAERDDPAAPTIEIRWDEIESFVAEPAPKERASRMAAGSDVWRGRTRLSRGDLAGAREAFSRALTTLPREAGVVRQLAFEGVARTAEVAPQDGATSAVAAFFTTAARGSGPLPRVWIGADGGVDAATGLVINVPPAWLDAEGAERAERALADESARALAEGDLLLSALCQYGARIAAADAGTPRPGNSARPREATGSARKALRLLDAWAEGVSVEPAARRRGRSVLQSIVKGDSGVSRLWALYALGRSLSMEDDPEDVRLGVGKMLVIPAAHEAECPVLARAALVQSALALSRIHDDQSAAALRAMIESSVTTNKSQGASK